jgi:hypothetical protein
MDVVGDDGAAEDEAGSAAEGFLGISDLGKAGGELNGIAPRKLARGASDLTLKKAAVVP